MKCVDALRPFGNIGRPETNDRNLTEEGVQVVNKPFTPDDLAGRVRDILDQ